MLNARFRLIPKIFSFTSPLRTSRLLLAERDRSESDQSSSRFYPPDCYQLSLAGTSSLLRVHLPPCTASVRLESPLDVAYLERTIQGFPSYLRLPVNNLILNHLNGSDQVSGFALLCTLTHPPGRIRFAYAMCCSPPIASFRPQRCRDALAIRIVFPLIGVTPTSFSRPGLPATLGKHNKGRSKCSGLCW